MSSESVEAQLARIDERWHTVTQKLEKLDGLPATLAAISTRMGALESQMASAQPTIQEFITIKHKVVGAGQIGKWIWVAVAAVLGVIAGSREAIFHWFSKG